MINYLLATQRVESTIGVTLNRLLRYMKLAGAYLIATTLGAGTGFAAGSYLKVSGAAGLIGAVAGFGLCAYFIHWSRRARLYQYWVPHLSLFGRLAEGLTIPVGKQQLEMGREKVQRLFETPAEIFSIYEKSADVVCALFINRFNLDSVSALPVIGDGLKILMTRIVSPLRDALLTLSLSDEVNNPWQTLQENLVLVSNRAAEIQRSILWVVLIQIVGFLLAFAVWYVGVDWLADHWPDVDLLGWKLLITGLLTWIMYAAFVYPIAVNAMLDEFLKLKKSAQDIDAGSEQQLSSFSTYEQIVKQGQTFTIPAANNVETDSGSSDNNEKVDD